MLPHITLLPLAAIRTDGGTQIRAELNQFVVDDYAIAMRQGADFPPIVVFSDGQDHWLADGFHRLAAGQQAGLAEISAAIHAGGRRDALLYAVGANARHGLPRTNLDKRRAALALLEDPEWCRWSDREIARVAAVSHEFVRTLRARLSVNGCQMSERSVRRGASTYSMSTGQIGSTQRLAPEVRDLLRETPIAEERAELLALARLEPNEQREVAERIVSGTARTVKRAVRAAEAERRDLQVQTTNAAFDAPLPHPREIRPGEWWCLGRHLLYCGNTADDAFTSCLPEVQLAFADPPYNTGVADWDTDFRWKHDWLIDRAEVVAVTPGIATLLDFARTTAMPYRWTVACWIDNGMARGELGFGNWLPVLLFSHDSLFRRSQDIVRVSVRTSETADTSHRGRKPSELLVWLLETFTEPGDTVIDPFLGSGTTLLAAEATGRTCIGGELNPQFCAEIICRWEAQTGLQAEPWQAAGGSVPGCRLGGNL